MSHLYVGLLFVVFTALCPPALAIDLPQPMVVHSPIISGNAGADPDIDHRYALVGIIAEGENRGQHRATKPLSRGVAVLRDLKSNHSVTLRVGDAVPGNSSVILDSVRRNHATLSWAGRLINVYVQQGNYGDLDAEAKFTSDTRYQKYLNPEASSTSTESGRRDSGVDSDDRGPKSDQGLLERWVNESDKATLFPERARHERFDPNEENNTENFTEQGEAFDPDFEADVPDRDSVPAEKRRFSKLPMRAYEDPEIRAMIERGTRE
ncbi:MAG: hypothetical protein NTV34_06380 [Proteobacteria bacterium]|nr:hypothetical protein [Pseudomonadota bacterium]